MRILALAVVLAACTSEHELPQATTLGGGQIEQVTWNGGICPGDLHCSGSLDLAATTFTARFGDSSLAAKGELATTTASDLAALVAAIPIDEPTGVLADSDGPGIHAMYIRLDGQLRVYLSNGFFPGPLGERLFDLRGEIEQCASTSLVSSYTSCTP